MKEWNEKDESICRNLIFDATNRLWGSSDPYRKIVEEEISWLQNLKNKFWSIEDAKNGDIIKIKSGNKTWLIIFKEFKNGNIYSHFSYHVEEDFSYLFKSEPLSSDLGDIDLIEPCTDEKERNLCINKFLTNL